MPRTKRKYSYTRRGVAEQAALDRILAEVLLGKPPFSADEVVGVEKTRQRLIDAWGELLEALEIAGPPRRP